MGNYFSKFFNVKKRVSLATSKNPLGKRSGKRQGEVTTEIGTLKDGTVILKFSPAVDTMFFTPRQAKKLANMLDKMSKKSKYIITLDGN